jgi:cation diffusion facilitator family transporter
MRTLTVAMMAVEIVAGWLFNSLALLADGWHMSTHAAALGISWLAFVPARRYARDRRFAFGTWKIEILGGFVSAILLAVVAGAMVVISIQRLQHPVAIQFNQAILVAGKPLDAGAYKARLREVNELAHVTVEIGFING